MKFWASMFQLDVSGSESGEDVGKTVVGPGEDEPLFKDPSEYDHLSEEERKELTRKMKQAHKQKLSKAMGMLGGSKPRGPS